MIDLGARLPSFLPYSFSGKSSALVWLQKSVIFSAEVVQTTTLRRKREGGERLEEMTVENSSYTEHHIPFFSLQSSSHFGERRLRREGG